MVPQYHFKKAKHLKKIWDYYYDPLMAGKSLEIVYPHETFELVCDENGKFLLRATVLWSQDGGKAKLKVHAELPEWILENVFGIPYKQTDMLTDHEKQAASVFIQAFVTMMEYGIIRQRSGISTIIPKNRAERKQLEREELFHKRIVIMPHSHLKKVVERLDREKADPLFQQKVRSHLRHLASGNVVTVKEHIRFGDLPPRPQHYDFTRMAEKAKPCIICLPE